MAYRNYELTLYKVKKERDEYHSARKEFRKRKRLNIKIKRDKVFKYVTNLFTTKNENFWKKLKQLESKNQKVNINVNKLQEEYEKIFTQSNCSPNDLEEKQKIVQDFLEKNKGIKFGQKTHETHIQNMLIELPNNKTVGLRGVSNEMLKYCPSSMLASLIAEMFD